jgi:geranylgeranyl pyrophosphate synthase
MASEKQPGPILGLEAFRQLFNAEFARQLQGRTQAAHDLDPLFGELIQTAATYMSRGGKRLRPYLVYLGYRGFGGRSETAILRLSVAQELQHNGWLIHDDFIDRDLRRYGGPNVAGAYRTKFAASATPGGRHLADSMAILAGDVAVVSAIATILNSSFPDSYRLAAASILQQRNLEVLGGETIDVLLPTLPLAKVTPERILEMYRLKTGSYSFVAPLQIGATLAGAPAAQLPGIAAFGEPLGVAFQIVDDLLGMFGNEDELGKSVLSDLREGKRTILVTSALALAQPDQAQRLTELLGNPKSGYRHLAESRKILENSGAKTHTEQLARRQVDQALKALPTAGFDPAVQSLLRQLAGFTIQRRA